MWAQGLCCVVGGVGVVVGVVGLGRARKGWRLGVGFGFVGFAEGRRGSKGIEWRRWEHVG